MEKSYFRLKTVRATHFPREDYHYAEKNRLKTLVSKANRLLKFRHYQEGKNSCVNKAGKKESVTLSSARDERFGRVFTLFEPTGNKSQLEPTHHFFYHLDRRYTRVRDALGFSTLYSYHEGLRPYRIIAGARKETFSWKEGLLVRRELENFLEERYTYDKSHNVVEKTLRGRIKSLEPSLSKTTYKYNRFNRLIEQKEPSGKVTQWTYLGKTTLPLSKTVNGLIKETYAYDENNILVEKHLKNGSSHRVTRILPVRADLAEGEILPALGLPRAIEEFYVDEEGVEHQLKKTEFIYDRFANINKKLVYSANLQLQYSLDFIYDDAGRLIAETDPLGQETLYTYDDFGNCIKKVQKAIDLETVMRYDACNRLTKVIENGRLTAGYSYDRKHRKIAETDRFGQTTRFAYDRHDNLTQITYPDGSTRQYAYDIEGALTEEIDGEGHITRYERNILKAPLTPNQ